MHTLTLKLVKEIDTHGDFMQLNFGVMDFAHDLKDAVRGICTAPRDPKSAWVYRKQDTYAMGYVAYGNFQDKSDAEDQYVVFSPNISNGKYNWGDRMYMASAANRDKAVKNAVKHLRPLNTQQVLEQVQGDFCDQIQEAEHKARKELQSAVSPVNKSVFEINRYRDPAPSALHNELRHMLQSGHEFLDKQLESELRTAFTAMDTRAELRRAHDTPHKFVEVLTTNGDPLFRGFNRVESSRQSPDRVNSTTGFVYQQHDLPEDLAGGISVLSMVDVGQYVAGVGYRAAPNMFYITRGEDE